MRGWDNAYCQQRKQACGGVLFSEDKQRGGMIAAAAEAMKSIG